MTDNYFRDPASQCRGGAFHCFDLLAKEEFRKLATEFNAKADQLECSTKRREHERWF
jgi:hypothetical protein